MSSPRYLPSVFYPVTKNFLGGNRDARFVMRGRGRSKAPINKKASYRPRRVWEKGGREF